MKKTVLLTAVVAVSLAANALAAHSDSLAATTNNDAFYWGVNGGVEPPTQSYADPEADLGAQFGYRFNNWRLEEGYNYYFSNNVNALMTNAYYDFRNSSKFTPYVGLGIGMASFSNDASDINFAYQANLGVDYQLKPNLTLGVNYRYIHWGTPSSNYSVNSGANAVNLTLNRYF